MAKTIRALALIVGLTASTGLGGCAVDAGYGRVDGGDALTKSGAGEHEVAMPSLIAIGGGLTEKNKPVFDLMLSRRNYKKIVIVPYASGDQKAAAESITKRIKMFLPDANCVVLPDSLKDEESRKLAEAWIGTADLVFFTGGDQSRITQRLLTEGRPNGILNALERGMLEKATPVAGTSAGAAMMSDPMFTGGGSVAALGFAPVEVEDEDAPPAAKPAPGAKPEVEKKSADKPKLGPRLGPGLGLVRSAIIDTHFSARGRLGRLIAALEVSAVKFGVGLNEDRAVHIHGERFTAMGDNSAIFVDARELKREGMSRLGARVSLLGDGDRFLPSEVATRVEPGGLPAHLVPKFETVKSVPGAAALIAKPSKPDAKPWDKEVVVHMLYRLAADPSTPQRASDEYCELVISADVRTRFAKAGPDAKAISVFEAKVDIIAKPRDEKANPAERKN